MAEMDMDKRIAFWLDRFLYECHCRLSGGSAAFPDVASGAGTDYVFPDRFTAHTPWDNVVE
ncbi:unnamed protein product [marine sediment metagenome]|uniref:Uncharacterized protein n=1 Tax=marine sediment metagenome TaxID=412755 RepID=X0ZHJ9_9ZZZZ